ncbi:MAG: ribonuclease PH [Bdellovibrionales bacterium]|nr:ribonuclease PH [Bdellovibrionales bacterium]
MAAEDLGRKPEQMREVRMIPGVSPYAEGSCEVSFGSTKVLCTASIEKEVPRWLVEQGGGWITAEYGMLPRSTHTRMGREAARGKQGGRTLEIQRLIGRALRRAVPLAQLSGLTIQVDCDVIVADGGTRTAAISGGWVAVFQAINWAKTNGLVSEDVVVSPVSAISVGVVGGSPVVDLCYEQDSSADFDCNLVFAQGGNLIEIQGTAEQDDISIAQLTELIDLGYKAAGEIFTIQTAAADKVVQHG